MDGADPSAAHPARLGTLLPQEGDLPGSGPDPRHPADAHHPADPHHPADAHHPAPTQESDGARPTLADKLDRLFRTTRPPGSTAEYTYEQVAAEIAERGGPTISASYLYLLRRGLRDNPTKRHLEALAGFFGVPAGYFLDGPDPVQERLGLLSALRDPRVHDLAMTAATLPEPELDVVSQLVTLAGDLDGLRSGMRRRGQAGDGPAAGCPAPASSGEQDRLAELELAYARICLQDGRAEDALRHLTSLQVIPGAHPQRYDEADWLTALAQEALGRPEQALTLLGALLDRILAGDGELPAAQVAEEVCRLATDAGDRLMAADTARRTITLLEDRGLTGTAEHVSLTATLMDAYLDLGQLLHASALAHRLVRLADDLADPHRQSAIYLRCAQLAEARGSTAQAVALARRALAGLQTPDGGDAAVEAARLRLAAAACLLRGAAPGDDPADVAAGQRAAEPGNRSPLAVAVAALEAIRGVLDTQGTAEDRSRWAVQRALADLALAEPVAAEVHARRALAQLTGRRHRPVTVEAQLALGDALRAQHRHAHADAAHEQAGRTLAGLSARRWGPWSAGVWRSLGDRWIARGSSDRAADAYRHALDAGHLVATRPAPST